MSLPVAPYQCMNNLSQELKVDLNKLLMLLQDQEMRHQLLQMEIPDRPKLRNLKNLMFPELLRIQKGKQSQQDNRLTKEAKKS